MDPETATLFANQLARWAEAAIDQGHFPFRRVESFPLLVTTRGELRPPLVFWINRDSFMAGGIILFPSAQGQEVAEAGIACSAALGLRYFVTWAPRETAIWEVNAGKVRVYKEFLFEAGDLSAEAFQEMLAQIMGEMKILSVLGAVPPVEFSPHYFVNLCRFSMHNAHPLLVESFRLARGEQKTKKLLPPAATAASQKGILTLLRLLSLVVHDCLPVAVQPVGLEKAMFFALDTLPPELGKLLERCPDEMRLPAEAAIVYYHLYRRLIQLNIGEDRLRAAQFIEILQQSERKVMGGSALPFVDREPFYPLLLLYPDHSEESAGVFAEVADVPNLAAMTLLRILRSAPLPHTQVSEVCRYSPPSPPMTIRGTLTNRDFTAPGDGKAMAARLRLAWPTRRFRLPASTPRWAWEFLYLLGLAGENGRIELHLPADWLTAEYCAPSWDLVREQFTLDFLARTANDDLLLRLIRRVEPQRTVTLVHPSGNRFLTWHQVRQAHRSLLLLALDLPGSLWSKIGDTLQIPGGDWPSNRQREVYLFSKSSLGRYLWQIVGGGSPLPRLHHLRRNFEKTGCPLPSARILEKLATVPWSEGSELPLAALDRDLSLWLGTKISLLHPRHTVKETRLSDAASTDHDDLSGQIIANVFVDGIPRFPEQYLYDYFRPELIRFEFHGPLTSAETFFDQVTLCDQQGHTIKVEGLETARALILASFGGLSPVSLPADRHITATILKRYIGDLRHLRLQLARQTHLRIADARAAESLVEEIWLSMELPPWEIVAAA